MIKVLSLVNEALLRLGKKDDAADEAGSLHAKVADLKASQDDIIDYIANRLTVSSDTLRLSSDSEVTINSTDYSKEKEFWINRTGTLKIKYDLKASSTVNGVYAEVRRNGAAVAGSGHFRTDTYVTQTAVIDYERGDLIQIYTKVNQSGVNGNLRNARIYYDFEESLSEGKVRL